MINGYLKQNEMRKIYYKNVDCKTVDLWKECNTVKMVYSKITAQAANWIIYFHAIL